MNVQNGLNPDLHTEGGENGNPPATIVSETDQIADTIVSTSSQDNVTTTKLSNKTKTKSTREDSTDVLIDDGDKSPIDENNPSD